MHYLSTTPDSKGGLFKTTTVTHMYTDGTRLMETTKRAASSAISKSDIKKTVLLNTSDRWTLIWLVFIQVLFVTLVYGPIAAFLVEMFPVKIRYTSMSLPYHIGNGVFGGLLPAVATYLATGAKEANTAAEKAGAALPYTAPYLEGLWYPIIVAAVSLVIGVVYLSNRAQVTD